MPKKQKLSEKIIRWLWYLLAVSVLFSAVVISLIRFALNEVESYKETIEQLASKAISHHVYIESLDARLVGLMPTLVLKGIHVLNKDTNKEILRVNNANIGVSVIQSIRHQRFVPDDIAISGTRLALLRLPDGQIKLKGFDVQASTGIEPKGNEALTKWFVSQLSLSLKESTVIWRDYKRKLKPVTLSDINVELNNSGDNHKLQGSFSPFPLGKKIEVAMDINGDLQKPSEWTGDFFVQGDEIYLAKWGERVQHSNIELTDGVTDFQLWGTLGENNSVKLYGDISVYQLAAKHITKQKQINAGLLGGLFELQYDRQGWLLNVDRFQYTGTGGILPETSFSVIAKTNEVNKMSELDVRVGHLDLQGVSEVVANSGLLDKKYETLIKGLSPYGKLNELRISSKENQDNQIKLLAHARISNVSTKQYEKVPGVSNVSGELWLDQNHGKLVLNTHEASVDFGNLFRNPIKLEKVDGDITWWRHQDGWQVSTTELKAENNEFTTLSNLLLYFPAKGPVYMDLHSSFAGSAKYKSNYLPVAIMKKPLIQWLDKSLVSGVISNGGVVYRGRLSEFPYRKPRGQFLVQLYTDNLELNYQDGWPVIRDADFDASFTSKGIKIDLHLARLFSSAVTNTTIGINDYRNAVVDVSGEVTGNMADVVKFVVKSPLNVSKELLDIRYEGRANTKVDLHIPLQKGKSVGYAGTVSLKKGEVKLLGDTVSLSNINGELSFANNGFASKNLTADIFKQTSSINVFSQQTKTGKKTYLATSGHADAASVLKGFTIPAYKHTTGNIQWQALLDFSDDKQKVPMLLVRSDLAGVAVNMPYPMRKEASSEKEFSLKTYFKGEGNSDLYMQYGREVSLASRLVKNNSKLDIERGHIRFANSEAILPKKKILHVTGSLKKFYPSRWVDHMSQYRDASYERKLKIPVQLNMNHLDISVDKEQGKEDTSIRPVDFPVVKGEVQELVFDDMPLGKLSLDMIHHKGDMKLNKLTIHSRDMDFNSSGRWSYEKGKNNSKLNVSLKSGNLGKMFKRLGLAAIINDGKSDIKGAIYWTGTPFSFSLAKLNGNLKIYIKDGSVADVNPGAGRVVGLLSLSELPRRLMLDFSDMFKKGLVFDEIKGDVILKNGDAFTKGMKVESSVADVKLEGRTGLVKRDYDKLVHVVPKVGDTLPVASGVLFGSQIGALVLLFEKLMGKEIEKATERKYHVTGSWEKPVIKRIDKPAQPEKPAEVIGEDVDDSDG